MSKVFLEGNNDIIITSMCADISGSLLLLFVAASVQITDYGCLTVNRSLFNAPLQ